MALYESTMGGGTGLTIPLIYTQNDDSSVKNNVICYGSFNTIGLTNLSFHLGAGNSSVTRLQVRKDTSTYIVNVNNPSQSDYNLNISGSSTIEIIIRGNLSQQYAWIGAQNITLT